MLDVPLPVLTSLLAGIPTIIKPFFGDQAFWSERVESLGVGSAIRKLTAEHLTEALVKATTDEKQIAKAKVVGEMIRKVRILNYGTTDLLISL